ncbi:MAG: hypothetical protein ABII06_17425, partial [Pseudomonadota bacterium]
MIKGKIGWSTGVMGNRVEHPWVFQKPYPAMKPKAESIAFSILHHSVTPSLHEPHKNKNPRK